MPKLLIVDDEPGILYSLRASLETDETTVSPPRPPSSGSRPWHARSRTRSCSTSGCPDMSGLDAFDRVQEMDPRLPVIIITAHGTTETAIEAMKRGAFEYLLKPVDLHQLDELVAQAFELRRMQAMPAVFGEQPRPRPRPQCRSDRRPLPGHAGGLQGHRPRRPAGRDRAHPRRERHRQGTRRPRHLPALRARRQAVPGHQLRRHSRSACWKANCSATRRARSPAPTASGSASSSRPTAARSSSTRSAT